MASFTTSPSTVAISEFVSPPPQPQFRDFSYFISMVPDDTGENYDHENRTVQYTFYLTKLMLNGQPCTILEWFLELWNQFAVGGEDACESFVASSLQIPDVSAAHMIWTLWMDEGIPSANNPITSEDQLRAHIEENMAVERYNRLYEDSLVFGSTSEFDVEYAFFRPKAAMRWELGPHLSQFVDFNHDTHEVSVKQPTVMYTAYL